MGQGEDLKMSDKCKEIFDDLLREVLKDNKGKLAEMIGERLEEASESSVIISLTNDKGNATLKVEGERLAILLNLISLEKKILEKLSVPSDVWEMLKQTVGVEEVED